MGTRLYVGNLPFSTTEGDLQAMFSEAGAVAETAIVQDRFTGRSRGFAFVTMADEAGALKAIQLFNGKSVAGRELTVNEARPREERSDGPRGGGGFAPRGGERRGGFGGGGGHGGGPRRGGGGGRGPDRGGGDRRERRERGYGEED